MRSLIVVARTTERATFRNDATMPSVLVLEPWGEEVRVAPGVQVEVVVQGPPDGSLEVEPSERGATIFAWPGSTVRLVIDGVPEPEQDRGRVPDLPPGMSTRGFLGLVLSGPEWALFRQDDHGNRFLVEKFPDREQAEAARRDFESRGHKQLYWVEQA